MNPACSFMFMFILYFSSSLANTGSKANENVTSFWAIADVPYSPLELIELDGQMKMLESNVDFLIHLGDIKSKRTKCGQAKLDRMDRILKQSPVPVFLLVGDNEYNDCTNIPPSLALDLWRNKFVRYDIKHWSHVFQVEQLSKHPETFAFVHKRTLFIGLNIVGGSVHDKEEWHDRLQDQLIWVKGLMMKNTNLARSVVIFGHADPRAKHAAFFTPFTRFLSDEFPRSIPVLYLCGDFHKWSYDPGFFKVDNSLRVRLTGGTKEAVVKITVDPDGRDSGALSAFEIERGRRG